jgi:hypothetical protein
MTFKKIDDFRVRPCTVEYVLLYISLSGFILIFSAALSGQVHSTIAWLSLIISAAISAFLISCRIKRHKRAKLFYREWLNGLTQTQINELKHRVKPGSQEQQCISTHRLNYRHEGKINSATLSQ